MPEPARAVSPLDEAVVEEIVRWYILNGGTSCTMRIDPAFGRPGATFSPWGVRDQIGVVLAECPYRVRAGNPFHDDATITAVERTIIAEVAYEQECKAVGRLQMMQGRDVWRETVEGQRWRDLWFRMARRFRADPTWPSAMLWLRHAFGRLVHGDPEHGQSPDAAFLFFVTGT
jgi:hypothetical protein